MKFKVIECIRYAIQLNSAQVTNMLYVSIKVAARLQ